MYELLAQVEASRETQEQAQSILDQVVDCLTRENYFDALTRLHEVWAVLLVVLGVFYLINGHKMFLYMLAINAIAIGAIAGSHLGGMIDGENMQWIGAVGGALLLTVPAVALPTGAVAVMGGLVGSLGGYGIWAYVSQIVDAPAVAEYSWAGALIGLVGLGMLGFVAHKFVAMVFTSLQGSLMAVSGLLSLMLKDYAFPEKVLPPLRENIHLLPAAILLPALLGLALQYIASAKKAKKKKPPAP